MKSFSQESRPLENETNVLIIQLSFSVGTIWI